MKKIFILLLTLCILNTLDYYTTIHAISVGAHEINPISDYFIRNNSLHYYKLIVLFGLCTYLIIRAWTSPNSRRTITWLLYGVDVVYLLIVTSNLIVIFYIH
ncbi:DUF5658 family protein [Desulfitobacterium hafniense]|uniref:DUF5658 family protein n=1 Tax=Desulfitobacterium hafniense TaxID=49338 RepID=UPI00059E9882